MKHILSLVILIVLSVAAIAFAADPAATTIEPTAPQAVALFLKETLFPIIGSFFLGILGVFLNRFGTKYKIEALTHKDNFLTQLAYQGVTMAEEKAAQMVGSKAALTGSQKLDLAVSHILSIMPSVSPERAQAITEATLAQIPGIGATGDKSFSLSPLLSSLTIPLPVAPASPPAAV